MTDLPHPPLSTTGRCRVAVAVGGGIGALLRGAFGEIVVSSGFDPLWATFVVNVTGSLLLGHLVAWDRRQRRPYPLLVPFAGVGILGAFTTFSLFSAEVFELLHTGDLLMAVVYPVGMIVMGVAAALVGFRMGRHR